MTDPGPIECELCGKPCDTWRWDENGHTWEATFPWWAHYDAGYTFLCSKACWYHADAEAKARRLHSPS